MERRILELTQDVHRVDVLKAYVGRHYPEATLDAPLTDRAWFEVWLTSDEPTYEKLCAFLDGYNERGWR